MRRVVCIAITLCCLMGCLAVHQAPVIAGDWPTFLGNNARTGAGHERLSPQLTLRWVYQSPSPPELAWEGPRSEPIEGKVMRHRVDFDRALQVAVGDGRLYFGSSVDHHLYCVDAHSGQLEWTFTAEGPIRLAPTLALGNVYFGSDDGWTYCLEAATGKEVWKYRAGGVDERLLARGRMISRWPVRTGVLVDNEIAYFGAGVMPHEQVFLVALNARTGDPLWINDTISHEDAGRNPLSPQGYLLASKDSLFVPSGRSLPAAFSRADGKELHHRTHSWRSSAGGVVGGWKALLADGQIYSSGPHHFLAMDQQTGSVGFAWINGRQMVVDADRAFVAEAERLIALDRPKHAQATIERQAKNLELSNLQRARRSMDRNEYQQQNDQLTKEIAALSGVGVLWETGGVWDSALVASGELLFAARPGKVAAFNTADGKQVWSADVDGEPSGLAVAAGGLFVSTDQGKIYAFLDSQAVPADPNQPVHRFPPPAEANPYGTDELSSLYQSAAQQLLKQAGLNRGFCLVVGSERGRLAFELAKRSQMRIYCVESDPRKVAESREKLRQAGIFGSQVVVVHADPHDIPFSNYFANLIVSDTMLLTGELPVDPKQLARFIKPCGGMLVLGTSRTGKQAPAEQLEKQLRSTGVALADNQLHHADGFAWLRRDKLPGAGSWSHQYGDEANTAMSRDYRVQGGLGVLWYGDPGPSKMINRHEAAAAPLSTNGRMFIQGTDSIMCYDAYNGMFLWEYHNPGALRTGVFNNEEPSNLAASDDALFVAVDEACTELDAATGTVRRVHKVPPSPDKIPRVWGYVAYHNGKLFGTSTIRKELESSLRRRGHTVENATDALFAIDLESGRQQWLYRGKNVMHVTIAIGDGSVFFIDSSISSQQRDELLRQDKTELKKLTPEQAKQKEAELKRLDVRLAVALDVETGKQLWAKPVDVTDCSHVGIGGGQLTLMYQDGHVVICGANANGHYWRQFLSGQFSKRRLLVLDAASGKKLWSKDANYRHRPIVLEDQILAEPFSFALHTGEERMREHPLTGKETKWQFSRPGHHCGMITATPKMLFFRSGFTGYYDLYADSGTSHFAGHRLGCWVNAIPGNGLLMIPEASAGCVCQFSLASTIVMEPREDRQTWKIYSATGTSTPVKQMALNLGAPGDRRDQQGKLWLAIPRPQTVGRLEYVLDVKPEFHDAGQFQLHGSKFRATGAETPWVYASSATGLKRCRIPLRGKGDEPASYRIALHFTQLGDQPARPLAIALNGRTVAEDLTLAAADDGAPQAIVKEFRGIEVASELVLELKPAAGDGALPTLCGIEIWQEE